MTDAAADDLAYVRQLSESGAHAPLNGGRFMAWWGLLITIGWTLQHFALSGQLRVGDHGAIFGIIWFSFGVLGGIGQFVLVRSMPAKAGAGSAGNRASRTIWGAGAFAIFSMVIGVAVLANRSGGGYPVFDWIVPLAFAVMPALIVTGKLADENFVIAAGYGAIVMIGLFAAFMFTPTAICSPPPSCGTSARPASSWCAANLCGGVGGGGQQPVRSQCDRRRHPWPIRLGVVAYLSAVDRPYSRNCATGSAPPTQSVSI